MPTYQRKQKAIEATRFTSDHGGIVRGVTPGDAPVGLAYSEHGGYTFHGTRIAFGDYMVGHSVVSGEVFEREYEEVIGVPFSALNDAWLREQSLEAERAIVHGRDVVPAPGPYPPAVMQSLAEAKAREADAIESSGLGGVNSVVRGEGKPKTRGKRAQESE